MGQRLTRRTFIGGVAAASIAMKAEKPLGVVVVGASAFGAWAALHLRNRGARVTLIDAWGPGNSRASSGGETRVIRAIYGPDRIYVEMVKRSYELWERLPEDLYVETGALWLHRGDDSYVRSSVPILADLGFPVDNLSLGDARKRYPQISFSGIKSVWLERRAGALSARHACAVVRDEFVRAGGTYRTAQAAGAPNGNTLRLTDGSQIEADAFVFACGPWLGRLFPEVIGDRVMPTRQEVYYFGTPSGSDRYLPAKFPVWIDFGERIVYGIPDTHNRGFKIADDTRGEPFDPTHGQRTPTDSGIAVVRRVLKERFPELAKAPLVASEVCQYENSPDGHLIIDRHPTAKNVWIAGGGSGHGFKLSPAVGEIVAAAVVDDKPTPEMFRISRLDKVARPTTQFQQK